MLYSKKIWLFLLLVCSFLRIAPSYAVEPIKDYRTFSLHIVFSSATQENGIPEGALPFILPIYVKETSSCKKVALFPDRVFISRLDTGKTVTIVLDHQKIAEAVYSKDRVASLAKKLGQGLDFEKFKAEIQLQFSAKVPELGIPGSQDHIMTEWQKILKKLKEENKEKLFVALNSDLQSLPPSIPKILHDHESYHSEIVKHICGTEKPADLSGYLIYDGIPTQGETVKSSGSSELPTQGEPASLGDLTMETLARINDKQKVVIAIRGNIPPVQYKDKKGRWTGLDGELGHLFAQFLSRKLHKKIDAEFREIAKADDRDALLLGDEDGIVDVVMSSFSITKERKDKGILFSKPYFSDAGLGVLIRRSDSQIFKEYSDLDKENIVIGVVKGTTGEAKIKDLIRLASITSLNKPDDTYRQLKGRKVDAVINDKPFLAYQARINNEFTLLDMSLTPDSYGIGIKHKEMVAVVNEFIDELTKTGALGNLIKQQLEMPDLIYSEPENRNITQTTLSENGERYTVQKNDFLAKIAMRKYQDPTKWRVIYEANREVIGDVPNLIFPGMQIIIPNAYTP